LQARYLTMLYPDLLTKLYSTIEAHLQNKETPPDVLHDDPSTATPVITSAHSGSGDTEAFVHAVRTWPLFPDTIPVLTTLSKHFKLIILSNIDRSMIAKTRQLLEASGSFAFDAVYTVQDAGAYKPDPAMLTYMLGHLKDKFGIVQDEVLMTAQSVFHDIVPVKGRGIATAWIDWPRAIVRPENVTGDEVLFVFPTLGTMAEAVEKTSA
ncbi:Haloacid dehalogenase-like hydrolase-domain-containing protein, partial [Fomes fomentarius]